MRNRMDETEEGHQRSLSSTTMTTGGGGIPNILTTRSTSTVLDRANSSVYNADDEATSSSPSIQFVLRRRQSSMNTHNDSGGVSGGGDREDEDDTMDEDVVNDDYSRTPTRTDGSSSSSGDEGSSTRDGPVLNSGRSSSSSASASGSSASSVVSEDPTRATAVGGGSSTVVANGSSASTVFVSNDNERLFHLRSSSTSSSPQRPRRQHQQQQQQAQEGGGRGGNRSPTGLSTDDSSSSTGRSSILSGNSRVFDDVPSSPGRPSDVQALEGQNEVVEEQELLDDVQLRETMTSQPTQSEDVLSPPPSGGLADMDISSPTHQEEEAISVPAPRVARSNLNSNNPIQQRPAVVQQQQQPQQRRTPRNNIAMIVPRGHKLRDEFVCPITRELITEPVIAADGHTYDRTAIERWLHSHSTSPKTGEPLEHLHLVPNHNLKRLLRDMLREGGQALYCVDTDYSLAQQRQQQHQQQQADHQQQQQPSHQRCLSNNNNGPQGFLSMDGTTTTPSSSSSVSDSPPSSNEPQLALVRELVLTCRCLGPVESDWIGRSFRVTEAGAVGGRRRPNDDQMIGGGTATTTNNNNNGGNNNGENNGGGGGIVIVRPTPRDFVQFTDATVSRKHFEIVFDHDRQQFFLKDLGSAGGTFIRIPPGSPCSVTAGMMIMLGKHQLVAMDSPRQHALHGPFSPLSVDVGLAHELHQQQEQQRHPPTSEKHGSGRRFTEVSHPSMVTASTTPVIDRDVTPTTGRSPNSPDQDGECRHQQQQHRQARLEEVAATTDVNTPKYGEMHLGSSGSGTGPSPGTSPTNDKDQCLDFEESGAAPRGEPAIDGGDCSDAVSQEEGIEVSRSGQCGTEISFTEQCHIPSSVVPPAHQQVDDRSERQEVGGYDDHGHDHHDRSPSLGQDVLDGEHNEAAAEMRRIDAFERHGVDLAHHLSCSGGGYCGEEDPPATNGVWAEEDHAASSPEHASAPLLVLRCFAPEGTPIQGQEYPITRKGATLGRKAGNTISFSHKVENTCVGIDSSISGEHATITYNDTTGMLELNDGVVGKGKGSTNGTWVRLSGMHEESSSHLLTDKTEILIGTVRFLVSIDEVVVERDLYE